jgi:hypothetical protein
LIGKELGITKGPCGPEATAKGAHTPKRKRAAFAKAA